MAINGDNGIVASLEASLSPITSRYLLVMNIPFYRGGDGTLSADDMWFKDLVEHLSYLRNFSIACPCVDGLPAEATHSITRDGRFAGMPIIVLSAPTSTMDAIIRLPVTAMRLWRAMKHVDIVHTGVAGWPVPYGWVVTPMARLLRKKLVIIVESAPWRIAPGLPGSLKARLRSSIYERLAKWCVSRSDLAIFTQDEYRRSFLPQRPETGHVIHASWINESSVISDAQAGAIWREKLECGERGLAILFVGRLDRQKGVTVLLDAIRLMASKRSRITLDILGSGGLFPMCRQLSEEMQGSTRVNVLGTVDYGAPLFELLRRYHAVVIPSISDEQPRIVYDAYSQGVPVLGTRTAGLRDCIIDDKTGWLVEPNNAEALALLLERATTNMTSLHAMGMEALRIARSMTHQRMHRERHRLLLQLAE
jgi:glycosyltransferase involved in cell wall biosynthesis